MSEILTYAPDINSMTGARGTFTVNFDHYAEVPGDMSSKIVDKINAEKEEG